MDPANGQAPRGRMQSELSPRPSNQAGEGSGDGAQDPPTRNARLISFALYYRKVLEKSGINSDVEDVQARDQFLTDLKRTVETANVFAVLGVQTGGYSSDMWFYPKGLFTPYPANSTNSADLPLPSGDGEWGDSAPSGGGDVAGLQHNPTLGVRRPRRVATLSARMAALSSQHPQPSAATCALVRMAWLSPHIDPVRLQLDLLGMYPPLFALHPLGGSWIFPAEGALQPYLSQTKLPVATVIDVVQKPLPGTVIVTVDALSHLGAIVEAKLFELVAGAMAAARREQTSMACLRERTTFQEVAGPHKLYIETKHVLQLAAKDSGYRFQRRCVRRYPL